MSFDVFFWKRYKEDKIIHEPQFILNLATQLTLAGLL
jgi:hypothetical protein